MKRSAFFACLMFLAAGASAQDWTRDPVAQLTDALASFTPMPEPEGRPVSTEPAYRLEAPLECRPEVIAAFKDAWSLAGYGRRDYEAAFLITRTEAGYDIAFVPMTYEPFQLPVQYSPSQTTAIVHTHPNAAEKTPGPGDYDSKVPNYVLSRSALYVTIPGTRKYRYVRRDWDEPCGSVS